MGIKPLRPIVLNHARHHIILLPQSKPSYSLLPSQPNGQHKVIGQPIGHNKLMGKGTARCLRLKSDVLSILIYLKHLEKRLPDIGSYVDKGTGPNFESV
jgi:hypothetical protein